ncbi:response regulator [Gemmata sp.]|uniref:response regulator n=1 Tax=Gemmata sp. TaxID=1914242 RepID=UPI003F72C2B0
MPGDAIMVVDDSPTEQRLVVSLLQAKGYRVITAVDGDDAIEKATRELPRLILLDVVMPKKNGYQVCRHLKTTPETQHIKVLMLTTKSQDADKFWGMKQGADGYLTKPFDNAELLSSVARFC